MVERITPEIIGSIVNLIPDAWLTAEPQGSFSPFAGLAEHREAYKDYLLDRLKAPHVFLEEAIRARSLSV
jgi:hypothetical protein